MKERRKQTGRQAERTMKGLKELRKSELPIRKPPKNPTHLEKPHIVFISKNVNSTKQSKKLSSTTRRSKRRRRLIVAEDNNNHVADETPSAQVGFREIIVRMLHTFCEREPTLTLKTLQNFGIMLVLIVALIAACLLIIFHDKGVQVLEFIAGDHQHSEASRVVVSTEKK